MGYLMYKSGLMPRRLVTHGVRLVFGDVVTTDDAIAKNTCKS
jgi:hypothetical protein